jgi:hypothetical protein
MPFRCSSNGSISFSSPATTQRLSRAPGASDAALTPYHVDRSKLFSFERLEKTPNIDAVRIAEAIEMTRFPVPQDGTGASERLEPKLVQAADFTGQPGDPLHARKANALYYEFEEIGMNRQLGYSSPTDIIERYPSFFWNCVSMHLDDGIKYLNMTASGPAMDSQPAASYSRRGARPAADGPAELNRPYSRIASPCTGRRRHRLRAAMRFARWACEFVSRTLEWTNDGAGHAQWNFTISFQARKIPVFLKPREHRG